MRLASATSTSSQTAHAQQTSLSRYGVDRWGDPFLGVNERGHLVYQAPNTAPVDLHTLAVELRGRGIGTPFVARFPRMIGAQMSRLVGAFEDARRENGYAGDYVGVYPIKVNQRRSVFESIVSARKKLRFGLEAGTKAELAMAMAQEPVEGSLLLLNGFKDREFMRMGFHAAELGHHVIIVFESVREVARFIEVYDERGTGWKRVPELGVRAKLYTRGSGRWHGSGGESSKFGLTASEILSVVGDLSAANLLGQLSLIHFHIGSQITQVKRIKEAVREGTRLYASLAERCPGVRYLDLGGGIGVDYDGSRTSYPSSANYTIEEYARQVVYEINEVIKETGAQVPTIVSESGRILVAHHSVTIADMRELQGELLPVPEPSEDEHRLIRALRETLATINAKNYEEYVHDAIDLRDESLKLFSAGYLTLEERASAEGLFHRVRVEAARIVKQVSKPAEEIVDLLESAYHKYLVNFSIFQSLPDAWSINHVFPAAPLSRHGERPSIGARVVDITCDSDGCVTTFAHPDENLSYLPLHERTSRLEQYYLGFFMTGAYQDSLANSHNLLSRCHEVVVVDADAPLLSPSHLRIELQDQDVCVQVGPGASIGDVLLSMGFDRESLAASFRARHSAVETSLGEPWALELLDRYPYLSR